MDRLVEATLRHGLVPPVPPEFPGITAGGAFAGIAGESSSFRHGLFHRAANWVEMVLGNGDVVRASPRERPDLFRAAAGALGTLGIVTMLELRLVEAKPWVRVVYHRCAAVDAALTKIRAVTDDPHVDFVDGILFSPDHAVVVAGAMTDDRPAACRPQTFSRPAGPVVLPPCPREDGDPRRHRRPARNRLCPPRRVPVPLRPWRLLGR